MIPTDKDLLDALRTGCRNCTRYRKESKTCQIEGKNTGDGYICCFDWYWDGKPFKKVKKKKKVEEDEDWEEEE